MFVFHRQNRDDGNHDQAFDERKIPLFFHPSSPCCLWLFMLKAKPGLKGEKKKRIQSHPVRASPNAHGRYERMRSKEIRPSTATAPIDERNFRHSVSSIKNWRFLTGNGHAESHYKMTYNCNVGLLDNADPLI